MTLACAKRGTTVQVRTRNGQVGPAEARRCREQLGCDECRDAFGLLECDGPTSDTAGLTTALTVATLAQRSQCVAEWAKA